MADFRKIENFSDPDKRDVLIYLLQFIFFRINEINPRIPCCELLSSVAYIVGLSHNSAQLEFLTMSTKYLDRFAGQDVFLQMRFSSDRARGSCSPLRHDRVRTTEDPARSDRSTVFRARRDQGGVADASWWTRVSDIRCRPELYRATVRIRKRPVGARPSRSRPRPRGSAEARNRHRREMLPPHSRGGDPAGRLCDRPLAARHTLRDDRRL
jgi:hypothetical protein